MLEGALSGNRFGQSKNRPEAVGGFGEKQGREVSSSCQVLLWFSAPQRGVRTVLSCLGSRVLITSCLAAAHVQVAAEMYESCSPLARGSTSWVLISRER